MPNTSPCCGRGTDVCFSMDYKVYRYKVASLDMQPGDLLCKIIERIWKPHSAKLYKAVNDVWSHIFQYISLFKKFACMPLDWTRRTESLSRVHTFSAAKRRKSTRTEIPDFSNYDPPVELPSEPFKPFDTLPLEIQLEIFAHCLPPSPHFDPDEAPLLITRVSRTWRAIALSTPRLWSTFEVEIVGSPGTTISAYDLNIMSTMKLWLERSKNYPLSVRVSHIPSSRINDPRSAELLSLLIPEVRRWRHVELVIPASNFRPLQSALPLGFPLLQSLTLQMKGFWGTEPAIDLALLNIPWHQLTTLNLQLEQNHLLTLDQYLQILTKAENLRDCTISAQCTLASDATEFGPISLTNLESLQLTLHEPMDSSPLGLSHEQAFITFLQSLSMKKLHTLKVGWLLTSPEGVWQTVHSGFLTVLGDIASSLRVLSIAYLPVKESQLLEYFAALPELSDLELRLPLSSRYYDPITDRLLSSISVASNIRTPLRSPSPSNDHSAASQSAHSEGHTGGTLLPRLKTLHIESSGKDYSHVGLVSMIQSRWDAVRFAKSAEPSRIKFYILSMSAVSSAMEKQIEAWIREGLDVVIDSVFFR